MVVVVVAWSGNRRILPTLTAHVSLHCSILGLKWVVLGIHHIVLLAGWLVIVVLRDKNWLAVQNRGRRSLLSRLLIERYVGIDRLRLVNRYTSYRLAHHLLCILRFDNLVRMDLRIFND